MVFYHHRQQLVRGQNWDCYRSSCGGGPRLHRHRRCGDSGRKRLHGPARQWRDAADGKPGGAHFDDYGSYLVLSHFKGHAMAGFGGAISDKEDG